MFDIPIFNGKWTMANIIYDPIYCITEVINKRELRLTPNY